MNRNFNSFKISFVVLFILYWHKDCVFITANEYQGLMPILYKIIRRMPYICFQMNFFNDKKT
jgi:hypothetical protein